MGRTLRGVARDDLAPEHVSLPLESAREMAEYQPEEDAQRAEDERRLGELVDPGYLVRGYPGKALEPGRRQRENAGHQRQQTQAPQEEEAEEREMPVRHVAQLVAKDGGHLDGTERIDQGVGEQHVAKVGEHSGDAGVDHEMPRVPDQKVIEPEADPARDSLQAIAKGSFRQAARGPGQANEQRRDRQHQETENRQLDRLGRRALMPLGPESWTEVLPDNEYQHHRQNQPRRLPRLECEIRRQSRKYALVVESALSQVKAAPGDELDGEKGEKDRQIIDQHQALKAPIRQHQPGPADQVDNPGVDRQSRNGHDA